MANRKEKYENSKLIMVCTLLFWKYYDLTPDKVAANRAKLEAKQDGEVDAADAYTE